MMLREIVVDDETVFDVAEGLHWFCTDYHTGQYSYLYQVLSELKVRPSPTVIMCESDVAYLVYGYLEHEMEISERAGETAVQEIYEKVKKVMKERA